MCIFNYKYGFIQYSEDPIIKFKAIESIKISFQKIIHKIWILFFILYVFLIVILILFNIKMDAIPNLKQRNLARLIIEK